MARLRGRTPGAAAKASLKRAVSLLGGAESQGVDTKPGELPMVRMKRG